MTTAQFFVGLVAMFIWVAMGYFIRMHGESERVEAEVQRRLKARDERIESKLAESLARAALSKLKDRLPLPGTECCALEGGYPVNQTNEE